MEKKTPQNQGKIWTPADLEKLQKLADGNTPTGLIAHKLQRSNASITNKASQQSISLQPTNQSLMTEKYLMLRKGLQRRNNFFESFS